MIGLDANGTIPFPSITRVELIDETGRAYTTWKAKNVMVSFQDNGKTMKVFLKNQEVKKNELLPM